MKYKIFFVSLLFLVTNLIVIQHLSSQTFIVNSTLDTPDANPGDMICNDGSGNCTLRAAIEEVESDGLSNNVIEFNLEGSKPFILQPETEYPMITDSNVTIDGTSLQNFQLGDLIISGSNLQEGYLLRLQGERFQLFGIHFDDNERGIYCHPYISNVRNSIINGNCFTNIKFNAISVSSTSVWDINDSLRISNNLIGVEPDSTTKGANGNGIILTDCNNCFIENNIIAYSAESQTGGQNLQLEDVTDSYVSNNEIFQGGVYIAPGSDNNFISDNLIYRTEGPVPGLLIWGDNNIVNRNTISNFNNGSNIGIQVITHENKILENTFINNYIGLQVTASTKTLILGNIFNCNLYGIDLRGNDISDPEPPIIDTAATNYVKGTSTPFDIIELYVHDDTGCPGVECQGKTLIGSTTVDWLGNWIVDGLNLTEGQQVVATTTENEDDTSIFSSCEIVNISTSTKIIEDEKFNIYPNPASDFIWIDDAPLGFSFEILNIHSELVNKIKISANSEYISTSECNPGIYVYQLKNKYGLITQRGKLIVINN